MGRRLKGNDNETNKTLAIIIGLIAAVALLILFITYLNKKCEKGKGKYNHFLSSTFFHLLFIIYIFRK